MKMCNPDNKKKSINWFATGHSQNFEFKICECKHIFKKNGDFCQKKVLHIVWIDATFRNFVCID